MLMLTLVAERVSNFIKLFLQDKVIYIPYPHLKREKDAKGNAEKGEFKLALKARLEVLAIKQPTKKAEKMREYRILVINVIIGTLIATVMNVNLVEIVQNISKAKGGTFSMVFADWDFGKGEVSHYWIGALLLLLYVWSALTFLYGSLPEKTYKPRNLSKFALGLPALATFHLILIFGYQGEDWKNILLHVFGFFCSGFFLSLGSKFWHDLLDLLFKVKNTKQRLSEPGTFQDYASAGEIKQLWETPRQDVAKELLEKYEDEIWQIEGVVSCSINQVEDPRSKLFKQVIEVEFTTSDAQKALLKLGAKGKVTVAYNDYYLDDYLLPLITKPISILRGSFPSITENTPVCYAYNTEGKDNLGSFGVEKVDGQCYAVSNLHVFATADECNAVFRNPGYDIQNRTVELKIGNAPLFTGTIVEGYKVGQQGFKGMDYCRCTIPEAAFHAYRALIHKKEMMKPDPGKNMVMFGAKSKYTEFFWDKRSTRITVDYVGFSARMTLMKIATSEMENGSIKQVKKGDSGAIIHYQFENEPTRQTGMLVAKSDNYAYMYIMDKND